MIHVCRLPSLEINIVNCDDDDDDDYVDDDDVDVDDNEPINK